MSSTFWMAPLLKALRTCWLKTSELCLPNLPMRVDGVFESGVPIVLQAECARVLSIDILPTEPS